MWGTGALPHACYSRCCEGISDNTDFRELTAVDYPVLSDLYSFIEDEFKTTIKQNISYIRLNCC